MLVDYYRKSKRTSPWDWVKLEYKPPKKLKDFQEAAKKRAEKRIKREFGKKAMLYPTRV